MLDVGTEFSRFKNDKKIIYQLEPLSCMEKNDVDAMLSKLRLCDDVWDYDESNVELLRSHNINAKHVLVPYDECIDWNISPDSEKDIDILIYGAPDQRRFDVLSKIYRTYRHLSIIDATNLWGDMLIEYISRSKVVLNIHRNEKFDIQEQVRILPLVYNNTCVLSEKSKKNYFGNSIVEAEYDKLHHICNELIMLDYWRSYARTSRKKLTGMRGNNGTR
jgi:hypothetical protein